VIILLQVVGDGVFVDDDGVVVVASGVAVSVVWYRNLLHVNFISFL
jgi:hypothetical protein